MNSDIRNLNRTAKRYEDMFENGSSELREDIDYHIENVAATLKVSKVALNVTTKEVLCWLETLKMIDDVEDANIFQRIRLAYMRWYADRRYGKALTYSADMALAIARLEKVYDYLERIKILCH